MGGIISVKVMSKKNNVGVPVGMPLDGYALYDHDIRYVEGRLLTVIESFGMKESQEKAAKDLIRECLYELYKCQQVAGEFLNEAIVKTTSAGVGWGSRNVSTPLAN